MRRPVIGARWLVEVGAEGARTAWQIAGTALGRLGLVPLPEAVAPRGGIIVVLDITAHPWRRRLQRVPANPAVAGALISSAADEFPFPSERMRYAVGLDGSQAWLCALETEQIAGIAGPGQRLQAILIGQPGPVGALSALSLHGRCGAASDFLGVSQWLIHRNWLKAAGRAAAVLGGSALVIALLVDDEVPSRLLARQVAALEQQTGDLRQKHQTGQRMQTALQTIAELHASPEARLPEILERVFASIPPGHALARIEYRNGTLVLGGTGPDARRWLLAAGVPDAAIYTESVGNYSHFRAEFSPDQLRQPTSAAPSPAAKDKP